MFSTNLVNKEYYILNKPVSKEHFETVLKHIEETSVLQDFLKQYEDLRKNSPKKENYNINSEYCLGEYMLNSSNVYA
ncbi:MAG: hypothetical protein WCG98_08425 [bacterium]